MNPRRVHELMREHFPEFSAARLEWKTFFRGQSATPNDVESFLHEVFGSDDVLYQINRKVGGYKTITQASTEIAPHVGTVQILLSERSFSKYAVIAQPGVVATWAQNQSKQCESTNTTNILIPLTQNQNGA